MKWTSVSLAVRAATGLCGGSGNSMELEPKATEDTEERNGRDSIAVLELLNKWCQISNDSEDEDEDDEENDSDDDKNEPLVEIMTTSGLSPLILACGDGLCNIVKYLLINMNAEPNSQNKTGFAPLHAASRGGHDAIVLYLLENGADLSIEDENGWTSLHFAAQQGHATTCSLLCQQSGSGVNDFMNIKNIRGESAARIAFKWGKQDVLDVLSYYEEY
jgi:ankyrin repeat protein